MAMQLPSGRSRGRRAPMAEINVTPLVDVMLVLLIIFMVTAPLMTAGVAVKLPDSRAKSLDQNQKTIQLIIDAKGDIYVDNQPVGIAGLADLVQQKGARAAEDSPVIFIRADAALGYGRVAEVMGELSRAGIARVSLVTNPAPASDVP